MWTARSIWAARLPAAARRPLLRRGAGGGERVVIEDWGEPALGVGNRPALAAGIVLDLVALDPADAEIARLRVAEIEPANGGRRPHRKALGEIHANPPPAVEEGEQSFLLAMVGLRRIAGRRPDAARLPLKETSCGSFWTRTS